MKILFVYKFLTTGGVETVLRARLDGLVKFGIEADAWFLEYVDGGHIFPRDDRRIIIGDLSTLEKCLEKSEYEFILTIDTEEIFQIVPKTGRNYKTIVEAHSPYAENLEYIKWLESRYVDAIFVPSRYQSSRVKKRLRDSISVIVCPNPLRENFIDAITPFSLSLQKPIVAWLGRFDELKNWKEFIKIASSLWKKTEEVEFLMVGRMPKRELVNELYRKLKKGKILPHVRWFNNFPHNRMPRLLDAIRTSGGVVVSTSKGESFGMTIAEAMARACAVVAPEKGPFPEFIQSGYNGLLYRSSSKKDGVNRIHRLLLDDKLRSELGERGRLSIIEKHAPEVALRIYAQSLEAVNSSA